MVSETAPATLSEAIFLLNRQDDWERKKTPVLEAGHIPGFTSCRKFCMSKGLPSSSVPHVLGKFIQSLALGKSSSVEEVCSIMLGEEEPGA